MTPLSNLAQSNYILIGMPASGKTSLGKRLASLLQLRFVDTDDVLRHFTGLGPGGLKAESSFAEFIRTEEAMILTLGGQGQVIATGGSVVYGRKAMRHLQSMGTIIYLEDSLHKIKQRVGGLAERGVILKPGQSFDSLYTERTRLYRRYANITFQNRRLSPAQAAKMLSYLIRFIDA